MPRSRDHDAQRARLSEAVFDTLAERGVTGLTLRAVAERADCTTGLVLHTFPDKRALLLHARDVLHERTRARADERERTAPDAVGAVRAVVLGTLPVDRDAADDARVWIGFLAAAVSDPALAERHATNSRAFADRLTRLLVAVEPEAAASAPTRALALAAAVEGISSLAVGDPEQWSPERQRAAVGIALDAALGRGRR